MCDAAEQLQDKGKLLGLAVAVKDDSATIAKKVFSSIADTAVAKSCFMPTPPLAYLIKRAHAAAIQEHLTEAVSASSVAQLRSRSGGQGMVKRRGSVRCRDVLFCYHRLTLHQVVLQNDPSFVTNGELQLKKVRSLWRALSRDRCV